MDSSAARNGPSVKESSSRRSPPSGSASRPVTVRSAVLSAGRPPNRNGRYRTITSDRFGDRLLGYHPRVDQSSSSCWNAASGATVYPPEITALGEYLTRISQQVLCSVLARVGISERDWTRAPAAARVRRLVPPDVQPLPADAGEIGLSSHKDDGFITMLRTTTPGLEVNRGRRWENVPADPACFVVNFGLAMEILTSDCANTLAAIMHRVVQQKLTGPAWALQLQRCLPRRTRASTATSRASAWNGCAARASSSRRTTTRSTPAPKATARTSHAHSHPRRKADAYDTRAMTLQRASVPPDGPAFETPGGLAQALQDGCFYLAIPEDSTSIPVGRCAVSSTGPRSPGAPNSGPIAGSAGSTASTSTVSTIQTEHVLADAPAPGEVPPAGPWWTWPSSMGELTRARC